MIKVKVSLFALPVQRPWLKLNTLPGTEESVADVLKILTEIKEALDGNRKLMSATRKILLEIRTVIRDVQKKGGV